METLPATIQAKPMAIIPTDFEQAYRLAKIMSASGLMPKGISSPEAVFVAMQLGAEIGLSPMASVQNIAIINNKPGIYGDAALAVVRASGLLEEFKEWSEGERKTPSWTFHCRLKRKGYESVTGSYSWMQACEAGLDKADPHSPWRKWTDRMMQFKARNFPLRDQFADILKGIRTSEENLDAIEAEYTSEPIRQIAPAMTTLKDKLNDKIAELSSGKPKAIEPVPVMQTEQNQDEKEPAPVESKPAEADLWADFRKSYINLKNSGFADFVTKQQDKLKTAPVEIKKEVYEKWGKIYPGVPFPISSEKEQPREPEQNVSFTKEYKRLANLKMEFPVFYDEAVKELNVKPDTVVNCVNIAAKIDSKVEALVVSDEPPAEVYEPPVEQPDTSGF